MGLRWCVLYLVAIQVLLGGSEATSLRHRRQANIFPNHPSEAKAYQPPLALGAPSIPVASSATLQNSYQPPISLIRSNEYQSPLNHPQHPYPANDPRQYRSQAGPQTYVLPNQPQHQSHSVQYVPPAVALNNPQQSFSVFQQPAPNSVPQPATSYSVLQQPPHQSSQGQSSFAILSDNSGQSTAERTYSTHSKVVGSHVPAQAIHKAPASEIHSEKGPAAKEKDKSNDEYVVYYYYYYDNDTTANNNLSLNFDDIPSLESYDNDKLGKEPEKSASARTLSANINSLAPVPAKPEKDASAETSSSQPRSVGDVYGRPGNHPLDATVVQPLKPVSNVFRYGSNEVPRFPVLPSFIVTEVPTTVKPEISTPDTLATEPPTTHSQVNSQPDLKTGDDADDDDLNNVLDNGSDLKSIDDKAVEEDPTTTSTTTTTEPPTTTEEPTTTTEKPRRRPSLGGSRRRFNPSPSSSFSSNRNRQTPNRSTSSTSSTTTTTSSTPTRRSFQGNRVRPRPPIGSNRPRPGSRITETTSEDKADSKASESTTASTTTTSSSRSRFTSASPRRFQSSRSRSQSTSSPSSTTSTTRSPSSRSRPTSRPRPNLISRNRPPRPGFPRPRPGSEPEEPETTTVPPAPTEEETSPETANDELPSTNDENNETEEDNETSVEETEEPTTTEGNRFSALFRPRNRNALGNRPRPVIGNRPSRS